MGTLAFLVLIVGLVLASAEVVSKTAAARADSNKGGSPPKDRVLLVLTAPFGTGFLPGNGLLLY